MNTSRAYIKTSMVACLLTAIPAHAADTSKVTLVDWDTRTASCPAKVTQSINVTIRVTDINDLLIDFDTGETAQYQLRAKGAPMSAVPTENPVGLPLQESVQVSGNPCDAQILADALASVRTHAKDRKVITPEAGGKYISWRETAGAAIGVPGFSAIAQAIALSNDKKYAACGTFITEHSADAVVRWVELVQSAEGTSSSGAPAHSIDFSVNLEPNQNYEFELQESWKGKIVGRKMYWPCGEADIFSLSVGPLITTLPYRTYNQQQVPTATGTQNELVVSGNTNVNVLGAALLNIHPPSLIPGSPGWTTGFAFSVGPVYTLGNAPSVSKLGIFVGGSVHLYRSFFLTPGIHIGQFADYPAGFHQGSVIPSGFGSLTPVTRNTAHFAIGITFKTTSFKKSSQNNGAASNAGTNTPTQNKQSGSSNQQPGNQGTAGGGTGGGGGANPQAKPAPSNQNPPAQPATPPAPLPPPAQNPNSSQ